MKHLKYYTTEFEINNKRLKAYHAFQRNRALDIGPDDSMKCFIGMDPGLRISQCEPFPNKEEAIEYLEEAHFPGTITMAIPYKGDIDIPASDKDRESHEKYLATFGLMRDMKKKFFTEMQSAKSRTISCNEKSGGCGSSFPRSILKTMSCPLCEEGLYSSTALKRILKAEDKYKTVRERLEKGIKTIKQPGICYIIGGWSTWEKPEENES